MVTFLLEVGGVEHVRHLVELAGARAVDGDGAEVQEDIHSTHHHSQYRLYLQQNNTFYHSHKYMTDQNNKYRH